MENLGLKSNDNHDQREDESGGGYQGQINFNNDNNNNNNNVVKKNNEQQKTTLRTPADIYEHPSFYAFIVDMPGLDAQNIKVKVENGILHVSGKKKKKQIIGEPTTGNGGGVKAIRIERRRARYMRKFSLAANANPEHVKAAYKEGVLSITVSKSNNNLSSPLPLPLPLQVDDSNLSNNNVSIS